MYKAKLISADFKESTMEFKIEGQDFIAKKGDYVIMSKSEFESLSEAANNKVVEHKDMIDGSRGKVNNDIHIGIEALSDESIKMLKSRKYVPNTLLLKNYFVGTYTKEDLIEAIFVIPAVDFYNQTDYPCMRCSVGVSLRFDP